jgi:hypothetical protein
VSLLKNSFLFCLCLLAACGNKQESASSVEKTNVESAASFTILTTGMCPPPAYMCAEKIIGKTYRISFVPAAGCIVPDRLGDSIDRVNNETYDRLKKFYGRDMQDEIYDRIQNEYTSINQTDSILRIHPDLKKYDSLINESNIYFEKNNGRYIARFVINESSKEKSGEWVPKVKLLVITDSAAKKPLQIFEKDSTLKSLYDLL